jgi:hypothetical protein
MCQQPYCARLKQPRCFTPSAKQFEAVRGTNCIMPSWTLAVCPKPAEKRQPAHTQHRVAGMQCLVNQPLAVATAAVYTAPHAQQRYFLACQSLSVSTQRHHHSQAVILYFAHRMQLHRSPCRGQQAPLSCKTVEHSLLKSIKTYLCI